MTSARNYILLTTLNIIFLIVGVAVLGGGIYLKFHDTASTVCQNKMIAPFVVAGGVVAIFISMVGLIVSCCKNDLCTEIYSNIIMMGMILACCFASLAFVDMTVAARRDDYNTDFLNFKNCLVEAHFCSSLASHDFNYSDFLLHGISSLQGGCCTPPRECGFEYRNATLWTPTRAIQEMKSKDCRTWSNKQNELCYNCDTCKAGFVAHITKQWDIVSFSSCGLIGFAFIIFLSSCIVTNNINNKRRNPTIHPES